MSSLVKTNPGNGLNGCAKVGRGDKAQYIAQYVKRQAVSVHLRKLCGVEKGLAGKQLARIIEWLVFPLIDCDLFGSSLSGAGCHITIGRVPVG